MSTEADGPCGSALSEGLGPLPDYAHEFRPRWQGDEGGFTGAQMRLYALEAVAADRKRFIALAKRRTEFEASAAAHHAGRCHAAYERHLTRHAAMSELVDALNAAAIDYAQCWKQGEPDEAAFRDLGYSRGKLFGLAADALAAPPADDEAVRLLEKIRDELDAYSGAPTIQKLVATIDAYLARVNK